MIQRKWWSQGEICPICVLHEQGGNDNDGDDDDDDDEDNDDDDYDDDAVDPNEVFDIGIQRCDEVKWKPPVFRVCTLHQQGGNDNDNDNDDDLYNK